jgi:peroxiredoxin
VNEYPDPSAAGPPPPPSARRLPIPPLWIVASMIAIVSAVAYGVVVGPRPRVAADPPPPDLAAEAESDLDRRNFRPLSGPLDALLADPAYKSVPTQAHPLLGRPAPDFTLADTTGTPVTLADRLKAGPVVLVFYYGYHCDHCVSQLFGLHKDIAKFREVGAEVLAVSADPNDLTRERFKTYGAFSFPVLADPGNAVATTYGTYAPAAKAGASGQLMHGTFVIDRRGRVLWANRGPEPFTENRTLLREARAADRVGPPAR